MADRTSYLELTFKHAIDDAKRRKGVNAVSRRAPRLRNAFCFCQLLMSMLRLPDGCIAFVPISPDVMKLLFDAWFGFGIASY